MKTVITEAPASSANLGPGFDVFAVALAGFKDRLELSVDPGRSGVEIRQVSGAKVPLEASKNGAGAVALALSDAFGIRGGVVIRIWKNVPIGCGVGSSAASAAAAVVAMDEAFKLKLSKDEMAYFAGKGEEATSGTAHYDNVAASIMGGFVIIRKAEDGRPRLTGFAVPRRMRFCIATPKVKLPDRKTEYARSILPKKVELGKMVENIAMASTMVSGFASGDIQLIGEGMRDVVIEEARKSLIPGYDRVRSGALKAGAEGVCISGAGPSMLAIADGEARGKRILAAMLKGFEGAGVKAVGFMSAASEGARVVD